MIGNLSNFHRSRQKKATFVFFMIPEESTATCHWRLFPAYQAQSVPPWSLFCGIPVPRVDYFQTSGRVNVFELYYLFPINFSNIDSLQFFTIYRKFQLHPLHCSSFIICFCGFPVARVDHLFSNIRTSEHSRTSLSLSGSFSNDRCFSIFYHVQKITIASAVICRPPNSPRAPSGT